MVYHLRQNQDFLLLLGANFTATAAVTSIYGAF